MTSHLLLENDRRKSQEAGKSDGPRLLDLLNRGFAQMSLVGATGFLTVFSVVVAVSTDALFEIAGFTPLSLRALLVTGIGTALAGAPIIFYAQVVIRQLKASRQALRLMGERLAWALHTAEHANDAKSRFLANMSHELRTPLNAIIGFSDIMRNQLMGPMQNPRYLEYARDINDSGTHLLSIINDILDLVKIEAGQTTMADVREFNVSNAIEAACTMVRPQAERHKIRLDISLPDFPVGLVGVERMVRQILINILSNAVKFTPDGGRVTLATKMRDNGNFVIFVVDTGIGMSQEDITIALTPFGQVDGELSRRHEGTGLGLPLAKAMMGLHDGRLVIRSERGKGTTVALVFPAARIRGDRRRPGRRSGHRPGHRDVA